MARSLPSLAAPEGTRTAPQVLSSVGSEVVAGTAFSLFTSRLAMDEIRRVTVDTPADMRALPLGMDLTDTRGVQWPVATERSATLKGTARRYLGQDGMAPGFPTDTGKALILPREYPGLREATSPDYPLKALMSLDPSTWWDGQLPLPSGSEVVRPKDVEPAYVEVSRGDAAELGLVEGGLVKVISPNATLLLPVRIAGDGSKMGHVFVPWGGDVRTHALAPSFPLDRNGVPSWTVFPVRLEPVLVDMD